MSKLTRTLILAATVAAMNLASTTTLAHAGTNDDLASKRHRVLGQLELIAEDAATAQQQLGRELGLLPAGDPGPGRRNCRPGCRLTPPSGSWRIGGPTTTRTTRMSPAELQAWMQAKDRPDTSTEPPAQAPAPAQPTGPSGQPGSSSRLGGWRRCWRSSLDSPAGRQACQPQSLVGQAA